MSASSVSSPRRRSGLALAAVLALLVALGACTEQRTVPDKYGDTTERNFTEGCIQALTQRPGVPDSSFDDADLGDTEPMTVADATEVCTCSYEAISGPDGISFAQFKEINDRLEDEPGPLPQVMLDIIEGCADEAPLG